MKEKNINDVNEKFVPIMLDKERKLFFSFLSSEYMAEKYESAPAAIIKLGELASQTEGPLTQEFLNLVLDFLYAMLLDENELDSENALSLRKLKSICGFNNFTYIVEKISIALKLSLPKNEESEGEANPTKSKA